MTRKDAGMKNRYIQRRSYRNRSARLDLFELKRLGLSEQDISNLMMAQSGMISR